MPASNGQFTGAVPGLNLRAWALMTNSEGQSFGRTAAKSFNCTLANGSGGNFTLTLTQAMADTNVTLQAVLPDGLVVGGTATTTGAISFVTKLPGGATTQPTMLWVGVYG